MRAQHYLSYHMIYVPWLHVTKGVIWYKGTGLNDINEMKPSVNPQYGTIGKDSDLSTNK